MKINHLFLIFSFSVSLLKLNAQGHWHMYAIRDSAVTFVNTPVVIHISANDSLISDPGDIWQLQNPFPCDYPFFQGVLSSVNGGSLLFLNNDSVKYTPPLNFTGRDNFLYGICNNGGTYTYDTTTVIVTVKSITTNVIESLKPKRVHILPNPARNKFQIDIANYENSLKYDIVFMNSLGEVLKKESVHSASTVINTEDLNTGIYFIHVQNENYFSISEKVIIE